MSFIRSQKLDALRGLAIIFMVAFHANYLLVHLFDDEVLNVSPVLWYVVGKVAAVLFLSVSGMSFFLFAQWKNRRGIMIGAMKRSALLTVVAVGISVVTFPFLREGPIVFGIIHFFAISSLLLPFFTDLRKWSVFGGLLVIAVGEIFDRTYVENPFLSFLGLRNATFSSMDYYPIFPWFWFVLIGYGIACLLSEKGELQRVLAWDVRGVGILSFFGKHSLVLYVLHVPVLYAIFLLLH